MYNKKGTVLFQSRPLFSLLVAVPLNHAAGYAQRGTDCRQNRNQNLNQRLPSFLFHNFSKLLTLELLTLEL